jgi:hypothetical protein
MTKEEKDYKRLLASLGCMVCRRLYGIDHGDVELHHMRKGMGWGKGDYTTLIPLCVEHHRGNTGVHGLGTKRFPKYYGFTEEELLEDAKDHATRHKTLRQLPIKEE